MSVNSAIWFLWFYVAIYLCIVYWVRSAVARADPDYFDPEDERFGMRHAIAMWDMLLDSDLPGDFGPKIKYGIYVARAMLILYIPVFIFVFVI